MPLLSGAASGGASGLGLRGSHEQLGRLKQGRVCRMIPAMRSDGGRSLETRTRWMYGQRSGRFPNCGHSVMGMTNLGSNTAAR